MGANFPPPVPLRQAGGVVLGCNAPRVQLRCNFGPGRERSCSTSLCKCNFDRNFDRSRASSMPKGLWPWFEHMLGRDEPGHVRVDLKSSPSGVAVRLSFPRLSGDHKSLDVYNFESLMRFCDSIDPGTEIELFVPTFNRRHTMTKTNKTDVQSDYGGFLWRVTWAPAADELYGQLMICEDLADDLFASESSLWYFHRTGELLRAEEYLAMKPRPPPTSIPSISLLNGAGVELSEVGESEGESEGEDHSGSASGSGSGSGSEGEGESESESDFDFPVGASKVTATLRKGKRVEGEFVGRLEAQLGVWTPYLRFVPAEDSPLEFLTRGDVVATPISTSTVLVRILGGTKKGGQRAVSAQQACYICLLYGSGWHYATMPNVSPSGRTASAALLQSIEDKLLKFTPVNVAAAISQASRAAAGKETATSGSAKGGRGGRGGATRGGSEGRGGAVTTAALPAGWQEYITDDGETYYGHKATRMVQWHRPSVSQQPASQPASKPGQKRTRGDV